jgi:hypothetical protein
MANSTSNTSSSFMLPANLQARFQGELKPNKAVNDLMRGWSALIAEDVAQKSVNHSAQANVTEARLKS